MGFGPVLCSAAMSTRAVPHLSRLSAWLLLAPALLWGGCASDGEQDDAAQARPLPEVVATVNGVEIPRARLEEVLDAERARVAERGEGSRGEAEQERRREAMRLVIGAELCRQAALAAGMHVEPEAIEAQIAAARSQFATEEEFRESLAQVGLSLDQLLHDTERRLLIEQYVASVTRDLTLDPEEARRIYEAQKEHFRAAPEVRAAQIIVRFLPTDGAEKKQAARAKIDQAWQRLQQGEDFAVVARELSESPMAAQGGDLGYFSRGRTLPEFEDRVFATEVGQTTGIFETRHGYNIVKVLDRIEGRPYSFEEAQTSLMMVLAREQHDERLRGHVRELWGAAEITFADPDLEPNLD